MEGSEVEVEVEGVGVGYGCIAQHFARLNQRCFGTYLDSMLR
jgi:hypothetical protein